MHKEINVVLMKQLISVGRRTLQLKIDFGLINQENRRGGKQLMIL